MTPVVLPNDRDHRGQWLGKSSECEQDTDIRMMLRLRSSGIKHFNNVDKVVDGILGSKDMTFLVHHCGVWINA
jgi:hypothetical protein